MSRQPGSLLGIVNDSTSEESILSYFVLGFFTLTSEYICLSSEEGRLFLWEQKGDEGHVKSKAIPNNKISIERKS